MEHKINVILHRDNHQEKKVNTYNYNITELWGMIQRIHKIEEVAGIQTKGITILFCKITAENFPTLCNDIETQVHESFRTSNRY
jgi:hypothetical protein